MNSTNNKAPDASPFGDRLADAAAQFLKTSRWFGDLGAIVRAHRDDTGHGLFHDRAIGAFFLIRTRDGLPNGNPLISFSDETQFVQWLSRQSDLTLSGDMRTGPAQLDDDPGYQRITRQLILDHLSSTEGW